ncbi:TPA: hypothetical protein ACS7XF_000757 [Providencia alcalifaciens]
MMEIEELLVAIGVDTSQAAKIKEVVVALGAAATQVANEANKVNKTLDSVGEQSIQSTEIATQKAKETGSSISKLKMLALGVSAVVGLAAAKVLGFIDSSLAGAKDLANEKGALFKISQQELKQADEYQEAMKKTGLSIDSIKTKIALNLVPQLTRVTKGFNDWLGSNKELISEGLTQVIKWGAKGIQMVVNSIKAIAMLIDKTVGWKVALGVLVAVLAVLKRSMLMAFITNPITWVIAGIVGLMLLLDDLMVYLEGGDSLFGEFWGPAIEWVKSVMAWWNKFYTENKATFDALADIFYRAIDAMMTVFGGLMKYLGNSLKFLVGLFTGDSEMMAEAWQGMVDSLMQIWDGLQAYFSAFFDFLLVMWGVAVSAANNAWEGIKKGAGKAFDWIKSQASRFISGVKAIFARIIDFLLYPFKAAFNQIKSIYDRFTQSTTQWVDGLSRVYSAVKNFLLSPFNAAFELIQSLYGIFTDDSTTWTQKLSKVFTAIKDFLLAPFKAGWELVKSLFGISDADTAQFVNGIGNVFNKVTELIKAPFKAAFDWVNQTFGSLVTAVTDGVGKLKEMVGMGDGVNASGNFVGSVINTTMYGANLPSSAGEMVSNKSITINQGDMNVTQSISANTPDKAASIAANSIDKNSQKLAYRAMDSAIGN